MSDAETSEPLDLTDSALVWDRIAECLHELAQQWESGQKPLPDLSLLVARLPKTIRHIALVELIKLDMDFRWQGDYPKMLIEHYVEQHADLLSPDTVEADLIYEELHIRRQAGEDISIADYHKRFPRQAQALQRLVDAGSTTTLARSHANQLSFAAGDQVDDFDLLAQLGKGAFATVFLARQKSLQRLVALKISANQGTEPQTLARLDHPNIARVYDHRILPDDGFRLLYMKYVPGGTLQRAIQFMRQVPPTAGRHGAMLVQAVDDALDERGETAPYNSLLRQHWLNSSWTQTVCDLGVQMADALEYAHSQGVLHRDLKPANILLSAEAAPQLVDFNVSYCSKLDGASPAAFFGGSLAYMSPEQMEACNPNHEREPDELGPTSDIYSLAVVLWELLFWRRPFADEELTDRWSRTLARMIDSRKSGPELVLDKFTRHNAQCNQLLNVLKQCLRFDPLDRFATAGQLRQELRLCSNLAAKQILRPAQSGLLGFAQRRPVIMTILILLGPNLLAGLLNLGYNFYYVVNELPAKTGQAADVIVLRFMLIQTLINLVAFPLGALVVLGRLLPLSRTVKAIRAGQPVSSQVLRTARYRALRLSLFIAIVTISIWSAAGIAYPLTMHLSGIRLTLVDCLHLLVSLVLFGIIGNAYPFVAQALFSLRALYPNLIDKQDEMPLDDIGPLQDLSRQSWIFLVVAMMLPMFAVALMVSFGGASHRVALAILSVVSLFGTAMVIHFVRKIRAAVTTLTDFYRADTLRLL